jgi:hypothetical protein
LEYNEAVHQLFIDFKKAYDSVSRQVLYNIVIEFGIAMKLVRLVKMCLNETYSRVRVGKHLSDTTLGLTSALGVGGCLTPRLRHFTTGNEPVSIVHAAGWTPGPVWMDVENLVPTRIRTPHCPARSESLYMIKIGVNSFESIANFHYLGTTVTNEVAFMN